MRFGRFELNAAQRVLRVDGQSVALGGRAFDVLLALAQRRERLVTKQELLDLVWPGLVVEEHNIATQVGTLRKLLGPQAIATVPGRGYRFTALVDDDAAAAAPVAPAASVTPPAQHVAPRATPALPLTPLLGREDDLAALADLLQRYRLVTVLGAGGIGKSLLARHLLAQQGTHWTNGICWVELAGISDASMVAGRVAQAVGVHVGGPDLVAALAHAMAGLSLLLALDNAEHVAEGVATLAGALLDAAPNVRMLVTSQVPVNVAGEQVYRVGPLRVPEGPLPAELALRFASVALFVERARGADAHFVFGDAQAADTIELCRRLDGLPLAIELAAARAPLLGVQRLAAMMQDRLQVLTRNRDAQAPARQQTLRAALEWSHGLLDDAARTVFRRLAVVVDSASLTFIQRIVADDAGALDAWAVLDALGTLVDRSLVAVLATDAAEPRYRLLETPRAFALEQLAAAGERDLMQRRHAAELAALFAEAWPRRWDGSIGVQRWRESIWPDVSNAREAIAWARAADEPEIVLAIAVTLHEAMPPWMRLEFADLGLLCDALADRVAAPALRLDALLIAVRPMFHASREQSLAAANRAVALAREIHATTQDRWPLYRALTKWVLATMVMFEPQRAGLGAALAELEAIEDPAWPPQRRIEGATAQVVARRSMSGFGAESILRLARVQLATLQAAGAEAEHFIALLIDLELECGNAQAAVDIGERELAALAGARDGYTRFAILVNLSLAHLALGNTQRTRQLVQEAWPVGVQFRITTACADPPAMLAALEGRPRAAAVLAGFADASYAARKLSRHRNEVAMRERCAALLRTALGEDEYAARVAEGHTLPESQVLALALATEDLPRAPTPAAR